MQNVEINYWLYVRHVLAGLPYINLQRTDPDFSVRLRSEFKTNRRVICMVRAQALGLLNYRFLLEDPDVFFETAEPTLQEEIAFEEVLRRAHYENDIGQLLGQLAMLVTPDQREKVADVQDGLRCRQFPWEASERDQEFERMAQVLAQLHKDSGQKDSRNGDSKSS